MKYFVDGGDWMIAWKYDGEFLTLGGPTKFQDAMITIIEELLEITLYEFNVVQSGKIKVVLGVIPSKEKKVRSELKDQGVIFQTTGTHGRMMR